MARGLLDLHRTRELGGERIDIVPWSSDPVLFVGRALNPAKVIQATLDEAAVAALRPDESWKTLRLPLLGSLRSE